MAVRKLIDNVKLEDNTREIKEYINTVIGSGGTGSGDNTYIIDKITELTNRLNALADSDDTTLDQMSEIVAYIKSNKTLIEFVTNNKVNVTDIVDNLTTNANNKTLSAAQGVVLKGLIDTLQTKLNGISAGAEVNQNAFSNVTVGNTTITADTKTDTLTLVAGANVTLTPDATNDKITVAATDTTYSAFTGATTSAAGAAGLVPAPTTSQPLHYLKGDGTWAKPDATEMSALRGYLTTNESNTGNVGGNNVSTVQDELARHAAAIRTINNNFVNSVSISNNILKYEYGYGISSGNGLGGDATSSSKSVSINLNDHINSIKDWYFNNMGDCCWIHRTNPMSNVFVCVGSPSQIGHSGDGVTEQGHSDCFVVRTGATKDEWQYPFAVCSDGTVVGQNFEGATFNEFVLGEACSKGVDNYAVKNGTYLTTSGALWNIASYEGDILIPYTSLDPMEVDIIASDNDRTRDWNQYKGFVIGAQCTGNDEYVSLQYIPRGFAKFNAFQIIRAQVYNYIFEGLCRFNVDNGSVTIRGCKNEQWSNPRIFIYGIK
jgi:hypothetical protein